MGLSFGILLTYVTRHDEARVERIRLIDKIDQLIEVGGIRAIRIGWTWRSIVFGPPRNSPKGIPTCSTWRPPRDRRRGWRPKPQRSALADRFSNEVAELRLPLVGRDASSFVESADRVLNRFYILRNPDWFRLADLNLLDSRRRDRLVADADDLLFLRVSAAVRAGTSDPRVADDCRALCDRALLFTSFDSCWRALRARVVSRSGEVAATIEIGRSSRGCARAALLFELDGQIDKAIDELKRSVNLDPSDYWTRLSLARLLYRGGRVEEAFEQGRAAIAIDKNRPDAKRLIDELRQADR